MTFGEHVFLYCERGTNASLLAEPINAISNVAFLLAALVALLLVLWRPRDEQSADHFLLVGLVFLIGLGSLAFHLYADEGTELADVVPIGVFLLVYLGFALNRFLAVPPGWTVLLVIGFAAIVAIAGQVQCWEGAMGFPGPGVEGAKPCLNGSVGYLPALGALIIVGMLLSERGHRAAPYVVWAAVIFAISITLRSLDMALCDTVVIDGRKVGTHFIWHLLNALALFLLLMASLQAGPVAAAPVEAAPDEEEKTPVAVVPTPVEAMPKDKAESMTDTAEAAPPPEEASTEDEAPEEEPEPEATKEESKPEDESPEGEPEQEDEKSKGGSKRKPFFPPT